MKRSSFSPINKNESNNNKRSRTGSNDNNNDSVFPVSSFTHLSNSSYSINKIEPFPKVTKSIWTYYTKNAQNFECYQKKLELKNALMHMFEGVFPYLGVYIVGSSINGFGTNQSDVDMCFMVSREEIEQKTEALLLLKAIGKAMRRSSFIRNLNVIPAKCPIIKFHDSHNNLECDINLNNHIGIRNTHLLKCYSDLDWRVKPIVLSIKRWAKFHNINDASQKTVSSYSFALMAIFYMQKACTPPILPCLQKLYPDKFNTKTNISTLRLNESLDSWTSQNGQSLGEVFNGFLDYYSTFNFNDNVISVRTGELIPKDCLPKDDYEAIKTAYIKIEEPFDLSNTARSVYDYSAFQEIKNVFEKSKAMLKANKDFDCLVNKRFTDFNNSNYDTW